MWLILDPLHYRNVMNADISCVTIIHYYTHAAHPNVVGSGFVAREGSVETVTNEAYSPIPKDKDLETAFNAGYYSSTETAPNEYAEVTLDATEIKFV